MFNKAKRRASFYLHVNYPDGTDEMFRIVGDKGKKAARKVMKIVQDFSKIDPNASIEKLDWTSMHNLMREKKRSLRIAELT